MLIEKNRFYHALHTRMGLNMYVRKAFSWNPMINPGLPNEEKKLKPGQELELEKSGSKQDDIRALCQ